MKELTNHTPDTTPSANLGSAPAPLLQEDAQHSHWSSSRAETIYQAATVAAALLVLMSV